MQAQHFLMYAWILNQSAGYKHRHVFYAANGTSHLLYIRAENVSDNRWVFFEDRFGFRVKRWLHWHLQHHPKPLGASLTPKIFPIIAELI